jgi:hypothetical protein
VGVAGVANLSSSISNAKGGHLQSVAVRRCGRHHRWLGVSPDFKLVPWVGVASAFGGGSG